MRAVASLFLALACWATPLTDRIRLLDHRLPIAAGADGRAKPDDAGDYDLERVDIELEIPRAGLPEEVRFEVTLTTRRDIAGALAFVAFWYEADAVHSEVTGELAFRQEDHELLVILPEPVAAGRALTLVIEGSLRLDCDGDHSACVDDGEVRHLVSAAWLPLDPEFPLTDRFHISMTFRGDGTVLPAATGTRTVIEPGRAWRFDTQTPTVLPGFALAPFRVEEAPPILGYLPPGTLPERFEALRRYADEAREAYIDLLGPFPYETLGLAPIDRRAGAALGPQALVLMPLGEWTGRGPAFPPEMLRRVIAHEVGHQYFFNALAVLDSDEAWLSEGFAEFAAMRATDEPPSYPHYRENYWSYMLSVGPAEDEPLHSEAANLGPLRVQIIYFKGSVVLAQLRRQIGAEAFDPALRDYVEAMSGQITTTRELRAILEASTGASLEAFFDRWIEGAGFPTLVARVEPARAERAELRLTVEQARNPHGPFGGPLPIRVHRGVAEPVDQTVALEAGSYTFPNEDAQWLEIDPELTIFRRVRPDPSGDVNLSGVVDGMDLLDVAHAEGRIAPGGPWDDRVDVNDDQAVDDRDLREIGRQFGEGW